MKIKLEEEIEKVKLNFLLFLISRYTASSSSSSKPQSSALSIIDHEFEPSSSLSIPTTILKPLPTRKQQNITEDGELSGVFGSVLSPKDQWNCITCSRKFKQVCFFLPFPLPSSLLPRTNFYSSSMKILLGGNDLSTSRS